MNGGFSSRIESLQESHPSIPRFQGGKAQPPVGSPGQCRGGSVITSAVSTERLWTRVLDVSRRCYNQPVLLTRGRVS